MTINMEVTGIINESEGGRINEVYFYTEEWCKLPPITLIFCSAIMKNNRFSYIYSTVSRNLRKMGVRKERV